MLCATRHYHEILNGGQVVLAQASTRRIAARRQKRFLMRDWSTCMMVVVLARFWVVARFHVVPVTKVPTCRQFTPFHLYLCIVVLLTFLCIFEFCSFSTPLETFPKAIYASCAKNCPYSPILSCLPAKNTNGLAGKDYSEQKLITDQHSSLSGGIWRKMDKSP